MTERRHNQDEELVSMSLVDHLEELRSRLILALVGLVAAFLISLIAGKWFLAIVLSPFRNAMQEIGVTVNLQALDVAEPFLLYLKASLVLAGLISSPWLFYQAWAFVSAGLYKHERRFVYCAAPVSAILFVTGVLFFLLGIAPMVFKFFARFNLGVEFVYQPQITKTVNFILLLALVFGAAFQTPIAIVFAERMGLVTIETLCRIRKYVFLTAFVVGAMATPPDVVSQIALAVPLYILYEVSIIVCRVWRRKRKV
jgi:sec-independent protein translocase protein TatC